jgi:hypothetical protein
MRGVIAHPEPVAAGAISAPVLARLGAPRALPLLGSGRGAAHLDLDGFVVTVTGPGVPWMPNGVVVATVPEHPLLTWDAAAPPVWDPVVASMVGDRDALAALSAWLSAAIDVPALPLEEAPARLVGRGPGLTPEGDDVLAGAAIGLHALAAASGLAPARVRPLARSLCPADVRRRTGALSATLLELAVDGAAPEPVHRLLGAGDRKAALADLRRLGASTGGAIAAGIALAAEYLMSASASH